MTLLFASAGIETAQPELSTAVSARLAAKSQSRLALSQVSLLSQVSRGHPQAA
jgi:hypothetical protein